MSEVATLILPGLGDSGPEHWQTYWERMDPSCRRVHQAEWDAPRCVDWAAVLDTTVAALDGEAVLVTHSSSCALVAHWARTAAPEHLARIRGALLVAPSDPEAPVYPPEPTGFAPVPMERLPFPTIVVASTDDEYVTLDQARAYAHAWGSEFVNAGALGHINSASGLGEWPFGYALLQRLRAGPAARPG
ncbi:RBBP9/YdeN family alpha/beta hydrolase [Longimicrobium terrae]|uniref:Alpha/beta hydrolase n=1 Tax=Longimicrobium terrae TaxID=1639882 RepID=A0A841H6E1_9BACT|nr:alpha/beta hydrolase [Longimicrobium terrae]MBB4639273.1 hypothetical protein [Longimicrobium terrae]MBB6073513.1 hypothetical protein [Longimicrobium terrae]NNC32237.1 alpha/beta hydrolase [Longimicrobium terrae]